MHIAVAHDPHSEEETREEVGGGEAGGEAGCRR